MTLLGVSRMSAQITFVAAATPSLCMRRDVEVSQLVRDREPFPTDVLTRRESDASSGDPVLPNQARRKSGLCALHLEEIKLISLEKS